MLDSIYHFNFDVAASDVNAKCKNYFTVKDNALKKSWNGLGNIFCNPPHAPTIQTDFVNKAYYESLQKDSKVICMLIPARTDTLRWHNFILKKASVYFVQGRIRFYYDNKESEDHSTFPTAIIVFNEPSNIDKKLLEANGIRDTKYEGIL